MFSDLLKSDGIFGLRRSEGLFGYRSIRQIGKGAHSTIHLVQKPGGNERFALKHVIVEDKKHLRQIEQLQTEYRIGRMLNLPGLRKSLELHVYRTLFHRPLEAGLLLEYVEGTPMDQARGLSVLQVAQAFIQVAHTLQAMHGAKVVHCDLKPGNILRREDGHVTLIDLGQACTTGTIKPRIQGTPDFISPEQVHRRAVTPMCDVFGIGACLYTLLCRKAIPTLFTLKKGSRSFLVDEAIPAPDQINPAVPKILSTLVMECIHTRPSHRPQTMTDVARRLETIEYALQRHPTEAAAPVDLPPGEGPDSRHP